MKHLMKSFLIAFSIYSKFPVPHFDLTDDDMKHHLCFFPFVGLAIGVVEFLWSCVPSWICISDILHRLIAILIPVFITGGFHVDGFMDTMDAIHSYQDKEKKLLILKDPHIGAFSVISVIAFFILVAAFSFEIKTKEALISVCFSFVISRILSALSVIYFSKAKKDGMLAAESNTDGKKITVAILLLELLISSAALAFFTIGKSICALASLAAFAISFVYYHFMSKKNFGGITGDLAGYFVCIGELVSLAGIAACCIFGV